MDKGLIFSLDATISCIVLLLSLSMMIFHTDLYAQENISQGNSAKKELFAIALSDAIVKNRNIDEPSQGAAYYNTEKKRVEINSLDSALLNKIKPREFGEYELSALYELNQDGKNYFFNQNGSGCIAIERFVIIKEIVNRHSILGVVVCEN